MNTKKNGSTVAPSRRSFLAGAGAVSAAALVSGCASSAPVNAGGTGTSPTYPALDITDNDILNFALNLEYLEAEFYLRGATGAGLSTADALSGAGTVTGGTSAVPSPTASFTAYLNEISQNELNHVRFLQAAISGNSGTPVARPNIDFTNAFNALASAAGIGSTFDPFSSMDAFLVGAFVFEDVGVTAYIGAAPAITSSTILTAAAGIAAVEAYHAAEIRLRIAGEAKITSNSTYLNYANQISALRATLGGGNETTLSINSIVASSAANAIGFSRTTDEVLHIVYGTAGGAGVKSGAFFPNGLNGTIFTTTS